MVFSGLSPRMYLYSLPLVLPFVPAGLRRAALARIGGTPTAAVDDDPVAAMIGAAAGYAAALPMPTRPDDDGLARLTMPVFVGLGGRSAVHDPVAAAGRARTLPDCTAVVWAAATHSLPMQVPRELDAVLRENPGLW